MPDFQKCKNFGRHISTRRLTQDEGNWTKKGVMANIAQEHTFKEEHSCQAQGEKTIPVKKTLWKKDQPATSTKNHREADSGDITAPEMLTHTEPHHQLSDTPGQRTGPGIAVLTLPSLKTKIDDARLR